MASQNNGTYYLGRIVRSESLTHERINEAILKPKPVLVNKFEWTFVEAKELEFDGTKVVFAKLCKYHPDAEVSVLDLEKGEVVRQDEPNLIISSSRFLYIPSVSGVVFLRIPNHIEVRAFMRMFGKIVEKTHGDFFVLCKVDAVSDLRSFAVKISKLQRIISISATVYPPILCSVRCGSP